MSSSSTNESAAAAETTPPKPKWTRESARKAMEDAHKNLLDTADATMNDEDFILACVGAARSMTTRLEQDKMVRKLEQEADNINASIRAQFSLN